jgi:hypothetical protein
MLESVRALLEGAIDYAGLFPPAELSMTGAVAAYQQYLAGDHGWMLGRFIVPCSRLAEFEEALVASPREPKWRVSVLTGRDLDGAIPAVLAFNAHMRDAVIDSLETKADSPDAIHAPLVGFTTYFEIPVDRDPEPFIQAIAAVGCRAKIRTGGVQATSFPEISALARFIRRCDQSKVGFKATAGLHHPLRGTRALTYQPESEECAMHGFLNVLLAAAFLWSSISEQEIQALLGDEDPRLSFTRKGIGWGNRWIGIQQIEQARQRLVTSFGSCSFDEPVTQLRARGLL